MKDKLDLIGIGTTKGTYISLRESPHCRNAITSRIFNDKPPATSFHKDWFFVKGHVLKVEEIVRHPSTNRRFELIEPSLASDKIPSVIRYDDAVSEIVDYEEYWYESVEHLKSLYKEVVDETPNTVEPVEFELEIIAEFNVDKIPEPPGQKYWFDSKKQLIDKILFPDILMHLRPCHLSSQQMYSIVRSYVKENIDHEVAVITSDFDFCFTVKKKIGYVDPIEQRKEIKNSRGYSYKQKRYRTHFVTHRNVDCFEMTYSPKNYKGYTPIDEIYADSEEHLKEKLEDYLKELLSNINQPLVNCPTCHGMGVVSDKK
jgi:hypothetical protein